MVEVYSLATGFLRARPIRIFSLLALSAFLYVPQLAALEVGDKTPDFVLPSSSGKTLRLSDYRGKIVLLDFWATWCSSCARSLPWMERLQSAIGRDNFQVLTVNLDTQPSRAAEYLAKNRIGLPVAFDPEGRTPENFNLSSMPTSFLIDKDGSLLFIHAGFNDDMTALERYINQLFK